MHRQQPVRRAVEDPSRPAHRARRGLTDLRKRVLDGAPGPHAQVEQRIEPLRSLASLRVATLHGWAAKKAWGSVKHALAKICQAAARAMRGTARILDGAAHRLLPMH